MENIEVTNGGMYIEYVSWSLEISYCQIHGWLNQIISILPNCYSFTVDTVCDGIGAVLLPNKIGLTIRINDKQL